MLKILKSPLTIWHNFWFTQKPGFTLGVFRIAFGLFILLILVISFPNWERFYGPDGIIPYRAIFDPYQGYGWSILAFSDSLLLLWLVYFGGIVFSLLFTLGLFTKIATIGLYIIYISLLHRNPYLINGQDQVIVMLLFFSIFTPLGASFSLDNKLWSRPVNKLYPMWRVRLMQISIAIIYIFSGPAKYLDDIAWRDGSAIYYVSLSEKWFRFSGVDLFHNIFVSKILTYWTLVIEISFPLLVWFSKTRLHVLAGIALTHFFISIFLNTSVFYFNIVMLVAFILFLEPEEIAAILRLNRRGVNILFYDGYCRICIGLMRFLKWVDLRHDLRFIDLRKPSTYKEYNNLDPKKLVKELHLRTEDGDYKLGYFAFKHMSGFVPSLYFFRLLTLIPGSDYLGPRVYDLISRNRFRILPCKHCQNNHETQ